MRNKNLLYTITLSLFTTSLLGANNLEKPIENSADIGSFNQNVIENIKNSLGSFYANNINIEAVQDVNNTEWSIISEPYNCSSWIDIGGGQEERTCDILEAKINKTKSSIEEDILDNLVVDWEERITQRTFTRGTSAPLPPVTPPVTPPPFNSGVRAFLNTPATGGLGTPIDISWNSENATQCSVTQQSGINFEGNGTVTFLTLGNNTVIATCTDGVDTDTVSQTIDVIPVPITVNLTTPTNSLLGDSFSYSWSSTGASSCIVSVNGSNVSSSAVRGNRNHTSISTSVVTISLNCTNGIDNEIQTNTVNIGWQPPPVQSNGMRHCFYDNPMIHVTVPRFLVGMYSNIYIREDSIAERLWHGSSNSQYWSSELIHTFSNSGRYMWGWNSNHRCWTNGFSPRDPLYRESFFRYTNRLGCLNGRIYLLEVVARCYANQYLNRYWKGARLIKDLNRP